jgi:zinc protease
MLKRIRALFGPIPRQPKPEVVSRPEPPQAGERRVTVEGPGDTLFIEIVYHAPAAVDSDFHPLAVLDSVLAGASNLNFFGTGISNKTSRLYRALVEGDVAAAVRGGLTATIDPYLYSINITVPPDGSPEGVLRVFDQEVDRIVQAPIEEDELSKAIKQARALFAYNAESITNQAFWMGYSEMFANYSWFERYLEKLTTVTPEDVLSVARKYLIPSNRVVGIYRPVAEEQHGS